jgi:predicted nucleic acid-binding protein
LILVDGSVWIDHVRQGDAILADMLEHARVLTHPFVIGELATGSQRQRAVILHALRGLPRAVVAQDGEVLVFIEREALFASGRGYIDVHLLASVRLPPGALLFTRDKRLHTTATRMSFAAPIAHRASPCGDDNFNHSASARPYRRRLFRGRPEWTPSPMPSTPCSGCCCKSAT